MFSHQLAIEMSRSSFGVQATEARPTVALAAGLQTLNHDAERLLLAGAVDKNGTIFSAGSVHAPAVISNRFHFTSDGNVRTSAKIEAALKSLEAAALIKDATGSGQTFKLTAAGFQHADELLSDDAHTLLLAASQSRGLCVLEIQHLQGWFLQTDGARFPKDDGDSRGEVRWRKALKDLVDREWLDAKTGDLYRMSQAGLDVADVVKLPGE